MLKSYLSLVAMCLMLLASSCKQQQEHTHDGAEAEHGHPHDGGLEPVSYTVYTDKTELFVEFKPLVVGETSSFAVHVTRLGENFTPLTEGQLTISLVKGNSGIRHKVEQPRSPGIFGPALQPKEAGSGYQLIFDIKAGDFTDKIIIENLQVYPNAEAALADTKAAAAPMGEEVSFLKEQAWKVEFATQQVNPQPFHNIIRTSGQILPAQGDETMVTASAGGIVSLAGTNVIVGAPVKAREKLFTISGGGAAEGNIDTRVREARTDFQRAQADFERAKELVADRIISQREFESRKAAYENAASAYRTLSANYGPKGLSISAPQGGFIKSVLVSDGEFVEAGQPLASITQNQRLVLRAEVPQTEATNLGNINSASFKVPGGQVYDTDNLNGRLLAYGRSAQAGSYLIPITFEIANRGELVPGSFVEVFLRSAPLPNALTVPVSAIMEDQGTHYVYVQTAGETFEKRDVKLGASDGIRVQLLSGVKPGERVVTKGAYQIKLSSASGEVPGHGHEH
jgi:membrane fusion protein, heavy metal efflux system